VVKSELQCQSGPDRPSTHDEDVTVMCHGESSGQCTSVNRP
jgi:hypothetical protein